MDLREGVHCQYHSFWRLQAPLEQHCPAHALSTHWPAGQFDMPPHWLQGLSLQEPEGGGEGGGVGVLGGGVVGGGVGAVGGVGAGGLGVLGGGAGAAAGSKADSHGSRSVSRLRHTGHAAWKLLEAANRHMRVVLRRCGHKAVQSPADTKCVQH
jgi:hypothetical protein